LEDVTGSQVIVEEEAKEVSSEVKSEEVANWIVENELV
jgi:hypothetical protein